MFLAMEFEMVVAAGIDARRLSPEVVYELAGKIIRDPAITVLAVKEMDATRHLRPPTDRNRLKIGTRAKVIRALPESERAALRARIGATPTGPTAQFGAQRAEVR